MLIHHKIQASIKRMIVNKPCRRFNEVYHNMYRGVLIYQYSS
jgi:hypothetical protein